MTRKKWDTPIYGRTPSQARSGIHPGTAVQVNHQVNKMQICTSVDVCRCSGLVWIELVFAYLHIPISECNPTQTCIPVSIRVSRV